MNSQQLQRTIHGACRDLGLDDDTRHDMQRQITGKESLTEMTEADLRKVIKALNEKGWKGRSTAPKRGFSAPAEHAYQRKIYALWGELKREGVWADARKASLFKFCARCVSGNEGDNVIGLLRPEQLDPENGNKVIEGLKAIGKRHGLVMR